MTTIQYLTCNAFQENSYILYDETGECIFIDPGYSTTSEERLATEFIVAHKLRPVRLLNTHCHIDHILGNRFIADTYGLPLESSREEEPVLARGPQTAQLYGIAYNPSPLITTFLKEGDLVQFGHTELEVLFCQGHSPGSLVFYCR
jgi:hydroxyacylglutathione hydrolase